MIHLSERLIKRLKKRAFELDMNWEELACAIIHIYFDENLSKTKTEMPETD